MEDKNLDILLKKRSEEIKKQREEGEPQRELFLYYPGGLGQS